MFGNICSLLLCYWSYAWKSSRGIFRDHRCHVTYSVDAVHAFDLTLSVCADAVTSFDKGSINTFRKLTSYAGTPDDCFCFDARSEERRVGKACRQRAWP